MMYSRGFGFRGASPSWPYTGRGRGGLPRCQSPELTRGYFPAFRGRGVRTSFSPRNTSENELDVLREESEALKNQLQEIETRISELETRTG